MIKRRYGAALLMLALGIVCLVVHFAFGWNAFQDEAAEHGSSARWGDYLVTWIRDVFENLQSEFIQLFFQFLLIAGAFRFMDIHAYEEDIEELRKQLTRIEEKLG
jgi:hypothetical protein